MAAQGLPPPSVPPSLADMAEQEGEKEPLPPIPHIDSLINRQIILTLPKSPQPHMVAAVL